VVGTEAEHPESFDIKEAMSSLVGFVRTYSLQHKIPETNTLNRFDKLLEKQVLNQKSYDDIVQTYLFLLQMRFKHQVSLIEQGKEPNNFINPKKLSNIDVSMLKKVFAQISLFQTKLKMDYFGTA
jgi:CBS domain-containing protein